MVPLCMLCWRCTRPAGLAMWSPALTAVCLCLQACKSFYDAERRHVYTTPKTFLELIKLYKSTLARKRKESQEAIDRSVMQCA